MIKKTIRMSRESARLWLEALRSDKYKQAKGRMTDGNGGYCCLGVLEKVLDGECILRDGEDELPDKRWLKGKGIEFDRCEFPNLYDPAGVCMFATQWNDDTDVGFKGIADMIEQCIEYTD